ncbi:MAG: PsbP-related protein [Patescibacteria group bacterium]
MTNQKGIANLLAVGLILAVSVVVLASVILYQRSMDEGKQVEANVNATTTNTAIDSTADWKIYNNVTNKYTARYPNEWKLSGDDPNNVFFEDSNSPEYGSTGIRIRFYSSVDEINRLDGPADETHFDSLAAWIEANQNYLPELSVAVSDFLDLSGYEADWPGMMGNYTFFLQKEDKIMVVSLEYLNVPERSTNEIGRPEFTDNEQSFFDSFEFTDETAGWQTYTNETYGYSIQYPSDWPIDITNEATVVIGDLPWEPGPGAMAVNVYTERSLEQQLTELQSNYINGCTPETDATINEVLGTSLQCRGAFANEPHEYTLLENNSMMYELTYVSGNATTDSVIVNILSTFQFTD